MKKILGLDLGTNSIGWALIEHDFNQKEGKIIGMGSRIVPMGQDKINDFERGNSISQTAERTRYRSMRRLRERHLLRRERLHRVLQLLKYLPEHYSKDINWDDHPGQFIEGKEPKLPYNMGNFIFLSSYNEMLDDFRCHQPKLLENGKRIPYDWTIYFLRKKALSSKISREELAWIILNFNQKRGYYQLRGEDEEERDDVKREYHELAIKTVEQDRELTDWYNITLENGWIYRRKSKVALNDWEGKTKKFIVTTALNPDGTELKDKEGNPKRSFRAPAEDDWNLIKIKTEKSINESDKTVGEYIFDTLCSNPAQKVRGKLIRTIERKYYKSELNKILNKQMQFHEEWNDTTKLLQCINELYPSNRGRQQDLQNRDLKHLILDDIIFFQRPLKSKKSQIARCRFECRSFFDEHGNRVEKGLAGIPKSHPNYQEFRIWQWIQNLRLFKREELTEQGLVHDLHITDQYLSENEAIEKLFEFLMGRKEIGQKALLKYFGLNYKTHRWNYSDDLQKTFPCNETGSMLQFKLSKVSNLPENFLTHKRELELWHLIYSVTDKRQYLKALNTYCAKYELDESFIESFEKIPVFEKEYGAYSYKALNKILPLMRCGKYWDSDKVHHHTFDRIAKIIDGEVDPDINDRVREKALKLNRLEDFQYLPIWLATYVIYNRHSEESDVKYWKKVEDLRKYLHDDFTELSLRNPIVKQIIGETLKVVADIWQKYGEGKQGFFDEIHVELSRELKNNPDARKKISNRQQEEESTNLRIKALLMELADDPKIKNVRPNSSNQHETLKLYEEGVNSAMELPKEIEKISKSPSPSKNEIIRYKAWLEQGYRSPYTGDMIPLSKLFTSSYEIEHVIPQARYFDDSFSNKVICESGINKLKDKLLGFEFIQRHGGEKVELGQGKYTQVFKEEEYLEFVKSRYASSLAKQRKLLLNEIPAQMIERQINDTRYISKFVMELLSNIIRKEGEMERRAANLVPCTGKITTRLKHDWGLHNVWNEIITPRFKRLNGMMNEGNEDEGPFGYYRNKNGSRFFQTQVPYEYQKGFQKKRIDHRHHAMDALVVACASSNHVNYLNNESHASKIRTKEEKIRIRFDLKNKLMKMVDKQIVDRKTGDLKNIRVAESFLLPWNTFSIDARICLESIIVSHKQNLRVINKSVNIYQKYVENEDGSKRKELVRQVKGDNWSIRKPLHKETVYGKVLINEGKEVSLKKAIEAPYLIINKELGEIVEQIIAEVGNNPKKIETELKRRKTKSSAKIKVWTEGTASRVELDTSFDEERIRNKVTDSGIKKILLNHLKQDKYANVQDVNGKPVKPAELAFSPEGLVEMNNNIQELNAGIPHKPIYKVRAWEPGNRFAVGSTGNKLDKYVEAAKGTNLYFSVYEDEDGKRNYETVPLNEVIEHQKQNAALNPKERTSVPLNPVLGRLLFTLSPNELVYVPSEEEIENQHLVEFENLSREQVKRIYKMVSSSGNQCFFIQNDIAVPVVNKIEFTALNKMERAISNEMIKEVCWKIKVNRLGFVTKVLK